MWRGGAEHVGFHGEKWGPKIISMGF
jgi:hypothetical protein